MLDEVYARFAAEEQNIPHVTLRPGPYSGKTTPVSTADERFVERARRLVNDVAAGKCSLDAIPSLEQHFQLCNDLAAAADHRDEVVRASRWLESNRPDHMFQ